jgi:hypothetical protein
MKFMILDVVTLKIYSNNIINKIRTQRKSSIFIMMILIRFILIITSLLIEELHILRSFL